MAGHKYTIAVSSDQPDRVDFNVVLIESIHANGSGTPPLRTSQHSISARSIDDNIVLNWSSSTDDLGDIQFDIEKEIISRMELRMGWINRVAELVETVEKWANELGWTTRRIDKTLDDIAIGKHRVPALLLQAETCRMILEPVGRSAPGTDGLVDLYLMPAYDDIASIYHVGGVWYLRPVMDEKQTVPRQTPDSIILSKKSFEKVLAEMLQHAH